MRRTYSTLHFAENREVEFVDCTNPVNPQIEVSMLYREPTGLRDLLESLQNRDRGVQIDGNDVTIYRLKTHRRIEKYLGRYGSWQLKSS